MINKTAVDLLRGKIAELEAIRDALLPLASGQNIDPIFDKLEEFYVQLLNLIGCDTAQLEESKATKKAAPHKLDDMADD
jgi:hypothetical protein